MDYRSLTLLIEALENTLLYGQNEKPKGKDLTKGYIQGGYSYIPMNLEKFLKQIHAVKGLINADGQIDYNNRPLFIDVGCGTGTKSYLASEMGFKAFGVEVDPKSAKIAHKLLGKDRVFRKDARKFDFSVFDVIYFYCPMFAPDLQRQLEAQIYKTAKPGAFILANLKQTHEKDVKRYGVIPVWGGPYGEGTIYRKLGTPAPKKVGQGKSDPSVDHDSSTRGDIVVHLHP